MPEIHSLRDVFATLSFHDLRGILTRLQQHPTAAITKDELVDQLVIFWQQSSHHTSILTQLSPAAARALWWLSHAVVVPAVPF